jgi:hypothetical protein
METNARKSQNKSLVWTFGLLLLIAACSHLAVAQTNTFPNSGNVGVGTTSPASILTVQTTGTDSGGDKYLRIKSTNSFSGLMLDPGQAGDAGWLLLGGYPNAGDFTIREYGVANYLTIKKTTGYIGIGTTSPSEKLHVAGGNLSVIRNEMSSWLANNSAGGETDWMQNAYYNGGWKYRLADEASRIQLIDGKTIFSSAAGGSTDAALTWTDNLSILQNGNVGIGTSSPSQKFQVIGGAGFFNSTSGVSINGGLTTGVADIYSDYLSGSEPKLHLATFSKKSTASGITVDTSGNVGIGVASPTVALDILGSINVSGNINAKYQDVAEWVPASHALPAGTVVTLDPRKSNHVEASSQAYDTRVAGVVSEQPGITLGESGENKVLVATTGRVRVTVDASHAPIHIGDLLVTSDIAGVAMKSEPITIGGRLMHMPGTLIGKALEPLMKGTGEILVLLSLQ